MSTGAAVALALLAAAVLPVLALVAFTAWTARRVGAAFPPAGRLVTVDGPGGPARVHVVERGPLDAPPLLLVHGLGGHARNFTYALVDRLAGEFRVVVMERPGSGHSPRTRGAPAGPRADAAVVAGLVRALGLGRPVLVGHSLGGAVALAAALDHPDAVGGLALIAPLTQDTGEAPPALRPLLIASPARRALVAWTVATPLAIARRRQALDAIFGPDPVPADYATRGGGLLGLRPRAFTAASADIVAVPADLRALAGRYAALRVPVGVLFGTGDRILDPQVHGARMRGVAPGVDVEFVEGGHMLPLTAPDRVAAFIRRVARRAEAARAEAARAASVPSEPASPEAG